ncbi:MAG TPA: alpha-ketoacid dehydrogenase subunit beta, partial [Kiloniellales bacterium]
MPELTYRDAINLALAEEMRRDPKVLLMGEDVAA